MDTRNDRSHEWDAGPGLLEAVWQFRWLVAAVAVLAAVSGYAASFLQPTMYEGEARLLLADPRSAGVFRDSGPTTSLDPSRYVRNQAQFVTSSPVFARAAETLGGELSVEDISQRVSAQPSVDLDLITIRALAPTGEDAALLANTVAQAYQDLVTDEVGANAAQAIAELEEQKAQLQTRIRNAENRLDDDPDNSALQAERDAAVAQLITIEGRSDQIAVDAALYGSGVELFEQAETPQSPAQPKPLRNAVVAVVLGLLAASAFAWWRAEHTQSADTRGDAAAILRAPVLGEVPDFAAVGVEGRIPTRSAPNSAAAEAYQFIVAALEFALNEANASSVLLTSAGPADGKTVTALNLAMAAAQDGRRVILVDADERARGLTRLSGVTPEPGLTDLADPDVRLEDAVRGLKAGQGAVLPFVAAGSSLPDPAGFFRTSEFRKAMRRVKQAADLTVIDSPPLLAVSDTSAIASQVDGIVLVVTRGTSLRLLEDVRERLEFIGTPVLGYVFNRARPRTSRYGYGYGYGYGQTPSDTGRRAAKRGGKRRGTTAPPIPVRTANPAGQGSRSAARPAPPARPQPSHQVPEDRAASPVRSAASVPEPASPEPSDWFGAGRAASDEQPASPHLDALPMLDFPPGGAIEDEGDDHAGGDDRNGGGDDEHLRRRTRLRSGRHRDDAGR